MSENFTPIPTIAAILGAHKGAMVGDFERYRNHVYRVYYLAALSITDEYELNLLAIASAFHDIGIWTAKTFDYLQPSEQLARQWMEKENFAASDISKVEEAISLHHQIRVIKSSAFAENFRCADLYELSFGIFGLTVEKNLARKLYADFPRRGFHALLLKLFFKQLFITPLNPLPMFKW